ncbi:hypothetical protein Drose_05620 [Dactylosporangium roseum]|uniref:HTH cro/C1-type domain-containing protein n=1 Tax=Dactylosporangium roseum TaxID=47989 RepID=A0ABY5Z6S3_9ACTN|nr:hypothetical protein [Dactylosporangium roseum]UWZ37748.1 hypothetical protein Drose_05620 [Dactylosporangium roseum]
MEYDLTRLTRLGKRRAKLLADTKENLKEIQDEIPVARRAGVTQEKIAAATGLSRVTVAKYDPVSGNDSDKRGAAAP